MHTEKATGEVVLLRTISTDTLPPWLSKGCLFPLTRAQEDCLMSTCSPALVDRPTVKEILSTCGQLSTVRGCRSLRAEVLTKHWQVVLTRVCKPRDSCSVQSSLATLPQILEGMEEYSALQFLQERAGFKRASLEIILLACGTHWISFQQCQRLSTVKTISELKATAYLRSTRPSTSQGPLSSLRPSKGRPSLILQWS